MATISPTGPPPLKHLIMHVHVDGKRLYSGVVDRDKSPLEWIPQIMQAASFTTGKSLSTKQTHPNDLAWTYINPNQVNQWTDSLQIDAFLIN